jgi:hypothetical protein
MMDPSRIPHLPFKLNELILPAGARYDPPAGTPVLTPYKELMQFTPAAQATTHAWLQKYRDEYIDPLGQAIATVFQVRPMRDAAYLQMPEEMKATYLSCVVTDAGLGAVSSGTYEWDAICVVVRYMSIVTVKLRIDPARGSCEIPLAMLWSNRQQEYVPVFDHATGKIADPHTLIYVLERYARFEGLVA